MSPLSSPFIISLVCVSSSVVPDLQLSIFIFLIVFYLNIFSSTLRLMNFDSYAAFFSYLFFFGVSFIGLFLRQTIYKFDVLEFSIILLVIYGVFVGFLNGNQSFDILKGILNTLPALGLYRLAIYISSSNNSIRLNSGRVLGYPEVIAVFFLAFCKYVLNIGVYLGFGLTYYTTFFLYNLKKKRLRALLLNLISDRRGTIIAFLFASFRRTFISISLIIFLLIIIISSKISDSINLDDLNNISSNRLNEVTFQLDKFGTQPLMISLAGGGLGTSFKTTDENFQTTIHFSYLSIISKFIFVL